MELKSGETWNGVLLKCDAWMNLILKDAVVTSRDGQRFHKAGEAYVRGNVVKSVRVPDASLESAAEHEARWAEGDGSRGRGRGRGGSRGRGRGGGSSGRGRGGRGGQRGNSRGGAAGGRGRGGTGRGSSRGRGAKRS